MDLQASKTGVADFSFQLLTQQLAFRRSKILCTSELTKVVLAARWIDGPRIEAWRLSDVQPVLSASCILPGPELLLHTQGIIVE